MIGKLTIILALVAFHQVADARTAVVDPADDSVQERVPLLTAKCAQLRSEM